MIMIGDALGGEAFIASLAKAVKMLSLLYAATPDEAARMHLESYIGSIERTVVGAVGARPAANLLDTFRCTVMAEKHRLEAGGASRA